MIGKAMPNSDASEFDSLLPSYHDLGREGPRPTKPACFEDGVTETPASVMPSGVSCRLLVMLPRSVYGRQLAEAQVCHRLLRDRSADD